MVDEVAQTRTKMRNEENPDQQMMRFIIFSEKRLKLVEITQYPYNGAIVKFSELNQRADAERDNNCKEKKC